jgi:hypothetical protein
VGLAAPEPLRQSPAHRSETHYVAHLELEKPLVDLEARNRKLRALAGMSGAVEVGELSRPEERLLAAATMAEIASWTSGHRREVSIESTSASSCAIASKMSPNSE